MSTGDATRKYKLPWVVFCDFDGTITREETLVGMFNTLVPELYAQRSQQMYAGRITLKEAVRSLIESIPSQRYPEVVEYFKRQPLRSGFESFLAFLDAASIPLVIVSGGIREMIVSRLGALVEKVAAIYAPEVSIGADFLRVSSAFEGRSELLSKVDVMRQYRYERAVAVGNGITDAAMARHASVVFARDFLARWLQERGVSFHPWDDFNDVQKTLSAIWKADVS